MNDQLEIIRRHARPMQPQPCEVAPRLKKLPDVRAILFDVYGTMLISGSGDVGTVAEAPGPALAAACEAVGVRLTVDGDRAARLLVETIETINAESAKGGVDYPEVEIVSVWGLVLDEMRDRGWTDTAAAAVDLPRLALEYEIRANPVWPMPGVEQVLSAVRGKGWPLGIVSNAQFFTPMLFPALMGGTLAVLGFRQDLCFYSYSFRRAKPGLHLFELARKTLESSGILPRQTLYIGNDVLNDMTPARAVGFRTALFAGDRRSLRLREGDPRVAGTSPDVVLTSFAQFTDIVRS